jgi:hypothetical protein
VHAGAPYNRSVSVRLVAVIACALASAALVPAAGGGRATTPRITFAGTVTLKPFDVTKACGAKSLSAKLLRVRCAQYGAFAGEPAPANVNYGWSWDLPTNASGQTTGPATEHGTLILNFGAPGLLYVSLAGKQRVIGRTTATRATAVTTGTWTISKGTSGFTGRHGNGTYTFRTARSGSESVFSVARINLDGSIS